MDDNGKKVDKKPVERKLKARGICGVVVSGNVVKYKPGEEFTTDDAQADRLIKLGAAEEAVTK